MKINSGEYKYRNIEIPKGIRPTTEKVREAVFSMINDKIYGATVLDLFAGSGCLGLEALSRGAEYCHFNDANSKNLSVIRKNIENCKALEKSELSNKDYRQILTALGVESEKFDIIFVDPPYESGYYETVFDLVNEFELLRSGGVMVVEHLYDNHLLDTIHNLTKIKEKKYGTIGVDVFQSV